MVRRLRAQLGFLPSHFCRQAPASSHVSLPHHHGPGQLFIITSSFRSLWFNSMDNRPPSTKVAIPKLNRNRKSSQIRHSKPRARRACNSCRKRKVKCTGEQPHCQNCVNLHAPCIYSQARRDRLKEFVSQTLGIASLVPSRATE